MKKFLLVEHQDGGCDYMIECGTRTSFFEAENMEAAIAYVTGVDEDQGYRLDVDRSSERCLSSAAIYEIAETHKIEVRELGAEREAVKRQQAEVKMLANKREQFERLKREFGE